MNRYQIILIVGVLAGLLLVAGCTEQATPKSGQTLPPTSAPTSIATPLPATQAPVTQTPAPTLFDSQVMEPPADLGVSVSVQKDPVYSNITTTFDGGRGQTLVQSIQARITLSDGRVIEQDLGKQKGDEITTAGTKGADRVQVVVKYMNGDSYLILDKKIELGRAGLATATPTKVATVTTSSEQGLYEGPVTQPPNSLSVTVDVNKEPIYRVITGTFRGGHGQSLISSIDMRAKLGNGELVTRQIANNIGAIGEIQGSDGTDHVQVIVSFKNGETYKIYEKTFGPRG
ncbi:hypothetical protein [Methanospirillum lacunae]|uniref:Uncharacterized protein n=1 Tax=Methanospirillum lacunae TaxID=668570 RepID=A0A2V2MPD0_9EURY|nr:hypothetical protein [Methanospirillum lacunae]PWR69962.1 hypothetical protein DK846_16155 [Methanospirillum lacunae]